MKRKVFRKWLIRSYAGSPCVVLATAQCVNLFGFFVWKYSMQCFFSSATQDDVMRKILNLVMPSGCNWLLRIDFVDNLRFRIIAFSPPYYTQLSARRKSYYHYLKQRSTFATVEIWLYWRLCGVKLFLFELRLFWAVLLQYINISPAEASRCDCCFTTFAASISSALKPIAYYF